MNSTTNTHDVIRQKRLQKFLLRCAKTGTSVILDASRQDNATFDTMLEVATECETMQIPKKHHPIAVKFTLPPVPTPTTGSYDCYWTFDQRYNCLTPDLPTSCDLLSDKEYPDFESVFDGSAYFH